MSSNDFNEELSQQGMQDASAIKDTAKNAGKKIANIATRKIRTKIAKQTARIAARVGRAAAQTAVKLGRAAVQAAAKLVASAAQVIASVIVAIAPVLIPVVCVIGILFISMVAIQNFLYEERGTYGSNDLHVDVENPTTINEDGTIAAIAMTEPQAIIDAYYKFLSCSSYTKIYNEVAYTFNSEETTGDFSGLRDYFKKENDFYLSDDFIRSVDELLHNNDLYYPEQVIKPVFGANLWLTDGSNVGSLHVAGEDAGRYYTSLLPYDTSAGDSMLDTSVVKDFKKIYLNPNEDILDTNNDGEKDDYIGIKHNGTNDEYPSLVAQSQIPKEVTYVDERNGNESPAYLIEERNVVGETFDISGESLETTTGIWDYGFGSVLQYQPEEKHHFIKCSYISVELCYHIFYRSITYPYNVREEHSSTHITFPLIGTVPKMVNPNKHYTTVESILTLDHPVDENGDMNLEYEEFMTAVQYYEEYLCEVERINWYNWYNSLPDAAKPNYVFEGLKIVDFPTNIKALLDRPDDNPNNNIYWDALDEFNKEVEKTYTDKGGNVRHYTNEHTDAKITDSWDLDIARTEYDNNDLWENFGNFVLFEGSYIPTKIYPLTIAVVNHAATFSGNIHCQIIPAGEEGCIEIVTELEDNIGATSIDHRAPVEYVYVSAICPLSGADRPIQLEAHRQGDLITQLPKVIPIESPWGFEYAQEYVKHYQGYIPIDFLTDRDFFLRAGLGEPDSEFAEKYSKNLKFLMDLDLLNLYGDNITYTATGYTSLEDMKNPSSDLYILSHLIAAEAGPSKLDELMVAGVFCNRISSSIFPNTFQELLEAYECYSNGLYGSVSPTDSQISSAIQVICGLFSLPSNVLYYGAEAPTHEKIVVVLCTGNRSYWVDSGYVSTFDRFGRPAANSLQNLAERLDGIPPEQAAQPVDIERNTMFVGDSFMEAFADKYSISANNRLIINNGSLIDLQELALFRASNAWYVMTTAASITKVYVWAGTYSIGLPVSEFKTQYETLLSHLHGLYPYAELVLITIPPVGEQYYGTVTSKYYIDSKNEVIRNIAHSLGYSIMSLDEGLSNEGYLKDGYTVDGFLLNDEAYSLIFNKVASGSYSKVLPEDDIAAGECFYYEDENGNLLSSKYRLYELENFDVLAATYLQTDLRDLAPGVLAIFEDIGRIFETIFEKAVAFFGAMDNVFETSSSNYYVNYGNRANSEDIQDALYHTLSFSNQILFSEAKSIFDKKGSSEGLTFLFVGKNTMSSVLNVGKFVPGVSTTITGMISPTSSYFPVLQLVNNSGITYATISVPEGTNILAVADGTVIKVETSELNYRGRYVTIQVTLDGFVYEITTGNLKDISVSEGVSVSQGDVIGTAGAEGLFLSITRDGEPIDPLTVFYQSTYTTTASLGGELNNADGTVNQAAIEALAADLARYVNSGGGVYHNLPINTLSYLQCTWWVRGRALQYLEMTGALGTILTVQEFKETCWGNGGQYAYYNEKAGGFAFGSDPIPNSIVCFPGEPGHVAYVEAVDYVNRCYYISHAGGGTAWLGIRKMDFGERFYGSGGLYGEPVFIYLDRYLK